MSNDIVGDINAILTRGDNRVEELVALVKRLQLSGWSQADVQHTFETVARLAVGNISEDAEAALAETLDMVVGWCAPGRRLF